MGRAGACAAGVALFAACDPGAASPVRPAFREGEADGPTCGDGLVDETEECDLGFANRPDGPCRECRLPACGDGVRDEAEECDDGDDEDDDGCRSDCTLVLRETWSRRWRGATVPERVTDLLVDDGGDAIVVGFRAGGASTAVRPWVARYSPAGDVRWAVALGEPGVAQAVAQLAGGDLVVAVTGGSDPDVDGEVRVVRLARESGSVELDVAPADESGVVAAVAAAGEDVFVAYNPSRGSGRVLGLDADGRVASSHASAGQPLLPLRALATMPGGDLVIGGGDTQRSTGFVSRVSPSGVARFTVDELSGPVVDVVAGEEGVLAAITARVEVPAQDEPWTWTTAADVLALGPDGEVRWSTRLAAPSGRREAAALARAGDRIVVVGSDPWPAATCAPYHCEQRAWAARIDPTEGAVRWQLVLEPDVQGRALAVGLHDATLVFGGEVRPLYSPGEGWLAARVEVEP